MTTIQTLIEQSAERKALARLHGYIAAHSDGYDYADYQHNEDAWALAALASAIGNECALHLAAARDHAAGKKEFGTMPARGKYIADHVTGQIDRALEIVCERERVS